ncbi:riboflavin synthase [candidate division KSB1 bacterium]|nr:riboflavin synthase [candidate division KSB1 bacterium]RQW02315.1 MAG: riboflavin synthase [candidate division KSB1 bacterium]
MFTGIVEEVGRIREADYRGAARRLTIVANEILADIKKGDSIAVDGVCLTVEHFTDDTFTAQAVGETLSRSTLVHKSVGDVVNLERALRASARLGGHFVLGHVDGIAQIISIDDTHPGQWLTVQLPDHLTRFVVEKGSIALDGLSLTVARLNSTLVSVAIIPHTWQATTLQKKRIGDSINVEVDIMAKYVQKLLRPYEQASGMTLEKLSELGF